MKKWSFSFLFIGLCTALFAQNPQWKEFQTPEKASLRGLSPVSSQVCWASGSGGVWMKTSDGGETWESGIIEGLDSVDFRSIHAFDAKRAVVASAGQPAVIYLTHDGGYSWQKVHQEGKEAFFDAISFADKKRGYVLGDPVDGKWMVLETEDSGKTWKSMDPLPEAVEGEAAFAASSSSMEANSRGVIFATGGSVARLHEFQIEKNKWTTQELPLMAQGESAKGVFAMTSISGYIILVGGDYTLLDSKDGNSMILGGGFSRSPEIKPFGYRSGVANWKKKSLLLAVGPSGSDLSKDGGYSWGNFSSVGFHAVKASRDGKSIWASGSQGRISRLIY